MDMIKNLKEKKGGFTLVELIVVLVILALLAAILVPTLVGYIDKANSEKNYQTAQTVRVAAQAAADEAYAKKTTLTAITQDTTTYGDMVYTLSGVSSTDCDAFNFALTSNKITSGTVEIDGHTYSLGTDGNWTAA